MLNQTNDYFWALKAMNGELWVSHINGDLWSSSDGLNFSQVTGTPFGATNYVASMAKFGGAMYFATSSGNVYGCSNGVNFVLRTTIRAGMTINTLASWNGWLYGADSENYSYSSRIFRTADGIKWSVLNTNDTYSFYALVPTANYLYLASVEDADYASLAVRSTADGTNWTRFFYTTSEGKGVNGHPTYFSQTGRAYYLSSWNGVTELFPVFNGVMESRLQTVHGFSSVVESGGQLFAIGSQDPSNWQSSPFVLSLLGSYTSVLIPVFAAPTQISTRSFQLNLFGENGSTYIIQASSNLVNWTPIYTNIVSGGVIQFDDLGMTNFNRRFYRAVIP